MSRVRLVLLVVLLAVAPVRPGAAAELRGTVRSATGAPLPGAQILIYTAAPRTGTATLCPGCYPDCGKRRETDPRGGFVVPRLSDSLLFRVLVLSRGFEPRFLAVDPSAGPVEVRLEPRRVLDPHAATTVSGTITDAYGLPVPGAEVTPIGWARAAGHGEEKRFGALAGDALGISDERGGFELALKETGVGWFLSVRARDLAPAIVRDVRGGEPVTIRLSAGALVAGRVMHEGRAVPGVVLGLAQADRRAERFTGHTEIAADSIGRFAFANAVAHDTLLVYGLMESLPRGLAVPARRFVSGPDDSVTVAPVLEAVAARRVAGRVTRSDGQPVPPGTRLLIGRAGAWDAAQVMLDREGRFAFDNAPPGEALDLSLRVKGQHLSPRSPGFQEWFPIGLRIPPQGSADDLQIVLDPGDPPNTFASAPPRGAR